MKSRHLVFSEFGPPESVLRLESFELPALQDGEVLVEILATPINPADLNFIEGTYGIKPELPASAGIECFAKVLTSRSSLFEPGDFVIPIQRIGGWADHAIAREENLVRVSGEIDPLQGAMLKVNPATAHLLLTHFEKLEPGDWVALNAANSGVGECTIQLARHLGIRTLCFVRNLSLAGHLTSLGASAVVEDSPAGFTEAQSTLASNRPKLAFNAVGGDSALRLMKLLGHGGTHITYGAMARKPLTVPNGPLIFNDIRLRGLWVTEWIRQCPRETLEQTYSDLARLVIDGKLRQSIDSTFGLQDFHRALERLNATERRGKILFSSGHSGEI